MGLNGFQRSVHRPVAVRFGLDLFARAGKHHCSVGPLAGFTVLRKRHKGELLFFLRDALIADQRQNIFVKNLSLAVGQFLEAGKGGVDLGFAVKLHTQLLQALLEGIAPAEFAQHNLVSAPAHIFGTHDFVGVARLEHAVLMDARGVGKGVCAHHRLVGLHHKACGLADHAAGRQNMPGIDIEVQAKVVAPGFDRHHHFFQAAVTRALAQAVDGAFHLAGAANLHAGQRIGYRHAEVVVAMHGPYRLVGVGNALAQRFDEIAIELRHGVAHRVGHVDGGGALGNHGFEHAAQVVRVAAVAVFGTELNVFHQIAGKTHRLLGLLKHLVGRHAQLLFHMQRRGGNKGVDAGALRAFERLGRARNVAVVGAGQRADDGLFDGVSHQLHGFEVAIGARRKACLDHVHLEAL